MRAGSCLSLVLPSLIVVVFFFLRVPALAQEKIEIPPGNRTKPEINVLVDCGVRADGQADDSGAIQRCIDNHPNQTILLPKTGTGGKCDYKLSQTISFKSYSTVLQGVGGNNNNSTTLCWTKDTSGIIIDGGLGQAIQNLSLRGSSQFDPTKLEDLHRRRS